MKTFYIAFVISTAVALGPPTFAHASRSTSGVYLTSTDYKEGRLAYERDCGSKAHKLELHDVLQKSYIHVTQEERKRDSKRRTCSDSARVTAVTVASYRILNIKFSKRESCASTGKKFWFLTGAAPTE